MAHTGSVRARASNWFDGAGWFVGLAVALFVFALLVVLGEFVSGDLVLWTGHRVVGTEQGGIVFYRWQGQNYSLDTPGNGSSKAVSVSVDPGNPAHAMIDSAVNRAPVVLLVGVPVAGGVALFAAGLTRVPLAAPADPRGRAPGRLRPRPGPGVRRPAAAGAAGRYER